jgi:hypothetical protein
MPSQCRSKRIASRGSDGSTLTTNVDKEFKRIRLLVLIAVLVAAFLETFTPLGTSAHADSETPAGEKPVQIPSQGTR